MEDLTSFVTISPSDAFLFTNASNNDMLIYTESNIQSIHLGVRSNAVSALSVHENSVRVGMPMLIENNVGIGTPSPTAPLQFASADANRKIVLYEAANNDHQYFGFGVSNNILRHQLSSAANSCAFYAATSATASAEIVRILGNGNVGIGTPTPNAPLQFANTNANRKIVLLETANNDHQYFGLGINSGVMRYQIGATSANHVFYAGSSTSASTELMRITGAGNVGIGRSTPAYKLDVNGEVRTSGNLRVESSWMYVIPPVAGSAWLQIYNRGEIAEWYIGQSSGTSHGLSFTKTVLGTQTEYARITEAGNVGIGTSTPIYKLDVNGESRFTNKINVFTANNVNAVYCGDVFNKTGFTMGIDQADSKFKLQFGPGLQTGAFTATPILTVSGTNVGIGTATANAPLQFANTIANRKIVLWEDGNNDHQYYGFGINDYMLRYQAANGSAVHAFFSGTSTTASTELMRIQGNGNVGIGTSSPAYKLDVSGDTRTTGTLYVGTANAVSAVGNEGGKILLAGTYADSGPVIVSRQYAGTESSELLLFNQNDVGGSTGPDRIRLRAANIAFDTYPSISSSYTAENIRMTINNNGNVGIGTTSPSEILHVVGNIYATGNITAFSDSNYKEKIEPISGATEKIKDIGGYTFEFKTAPGKRCAGVLAQEVQRALPEVVFEDPNDGTLSVAYGNLTALLIEAVKDLTARVESLEAELRRPSVP